MLVGVPKQIAHVEVVEVDASNFPGSFFHWSRPWSKYSAKRGEKGIVCEVQNGAAL